MKIATQSISQLAMALVLLVYLIGIPVLFADRSYVLTVLITASMLAFMALGVWLTFSIGRINIAQSGFGLIGAYAGAILVEHGVSFWLCLPLAGLAAGITGMAIGYPILRLKGVYFAMLTISLAEAIRLIALNGGGVTRGASGYVGLPLPDAIELFGVTIIPAFEPGARLPFYYLAAIILIAGILITWRIHSSRLGAVFRSLQQNEELASSLGIDIAGYRVLAFSICCAFGGIGGAFFMALQQNVYPTSFQVSDSVYLMMYCFIGGLSHPLGAVVGTFALVIGFELLGEFERYQSILFAAVMIGAMVALPNGLVSLASPTSWFPRARFKATVADTSEKKAQAT
ncbi:MAG: branched-chain amino acid ABC transporter permease [Pseudomonadota bacterium]